MTTLTTTHLATNPYAAYAPVPAAELQLLLMVAVVCLVAGLLLAEQSILRRMLAGIFGVLDVPYERRVGETV